MRGIIIQSLLIAVIITLLSGTSVNATQSTTEEVIQMLKSSNERNQERWKKVFERGAARQEAQRRSEVMGYILLAIIVAIFNFLRFLWYRHKKHTQNQSADSSPCAVPVRQRDGIDFTHPDPVIQAKIDELLTSADRLAAVGYTAASQEDMQKAVMLLSQRTGQTRSALREPPKQQSDPIGER